VLRRELQILKKIHPVLHSSGLAGFFYVHPCLPMMAGAWRSLCPTRWGKSWAPSWGANGTSWLVWIPGRTDRSIGAVYVFDPANSTCTRLRQCPFRLIAIMTGRTGVEADKPFLRIGPRHPALDRWNDRDGRANPPERHGRWRTQPPGDARKRGSKVPVAGNEFVKSRNPTCLAVPRNTRGGRSVTLTKVYRDAHGAVIDSGCAHPYRG
jgi:hypothetical protein